MKEKKLNVYLIVLVAVSVFMCAFDFFTGYISSYVNRELALGASLVFGMLHIMLWVAYSLFFILTVVLLLLKLLRGKTWIILTLALTAVFLLFVRSGVYAELYHNVFRAEREDLISRVISDDMTGIIQTGENEYSIGDLRISGDTLFEMFEHENEKIFVFEVYRPVRARRLLIYVENGGDLSDEFRYYDVDLTDMKDLGNGWYSGKARH